MSYPARAITDSNGMRPICEGLFRDELEAHYFGKTKKNVWDVKIEQRTEKLEKLLDLPSFNLLASRLINVEGYLPDTNVYAGRESGITAISIDKKRYRAQGYRIYERKEK